MDRREFLATLGLSGVSALLQRYWPRDGLWNGCPTERLPAALLEHELVQACWEGLDAAQCWDCHVHLIGIGDNNSGVWVNPRMRQFWHLLEYVQFQFYMNAACSEAEQDRDAGFVARLGHLCEDFPPGYKAMLLAFDYHHDTSGRRDTEQSAFHTPNDYAQATASAHAQRLEWIASIHPYREDAVERLQAAAAAGARAVKWLPAAMGMDPASARCDAFYTALARLNIPLLVHCGSEYAVQGGALQDLGNPLRLRRPLEQGVRVVVAHCASLGRGHDLDRGPQGPLLSNFELFARLMDSPEYVGRLFGELSAVTQVNRGDEIIDTLLRRRAWHDRLINGSDYPLPAVMPLFSPGYLAGRGLLTTQQDNLLREIRHYNPLLFDFLHKRMLRLDGEGFADNVFMTRRHFN